MMKSTIELSRDRKILRAELKRTESGNGSPFMEVGHSHGFSDLRPQLIELVQSYLCDEIPWEPCDAVFQRLVYESVWEGIHKRRGGTEEESHRFLAADLTIQEKVAYAVVRKIERTGAINASSES